MCGSLWSFKAGRLSLGLSTTKGNIKTKGGKISRANVALLQASLVYIAHDIFETVKRVVF
jgi:hypothetical protein